MHKRYWSIGIGLLFAGTARGNDLLSAYHQAQQQDTTLQAALYQRGAAIEARPQALAAFLPQLDANATYARDKISSGGDSVNLPGSTAPAGSSSGVVFGNSGVYALNLSQQIWSFASFHKLVEANLQVAQAEAAYRDAQQALILRVAKAYFTVLSAVDTLRTNQLERQAYAELLHQAKVRLDNGLSPQTDVKEAQSFLDTTTASVIDAESSLDDARRGLAELTAQPIGEVAALRDEIPLAQPQPASVDDWVASALEDNYALNAADLQAQAAERDISVNRAKGLPTLNVQASLNRYDYSSQLGSDQRDDRVGLVLDWPLFQGGLVSSQVRQARNTWRQLKAQYEGSRRDVERQTHAAFLGVVSGAAKIRGNREAVDSNRAAVEADRVGLDAGTRSEFQLLQAQTNYYDTLRAYYQSRYDYLSNLLTLKQLAGRLTEADLAAVDALLVSGGAAPSALSGGLSADTAAGGQEK